MTESADLPLAANGARVVVVGAGRYQADGLRDVPSVNRSASAVADLFEQRCGVDPSNITLVQDPTSVAEIGEALVSASEQASTVLLIYYIGHGLVHDSGELYLANFSTSPQPSQIAYTALRYSNLRESVIASGATSICVVLDCCFAGRAIGTLASSDLVERARVTGASVLAAAARDDVALAPVGSSFTAFSGELILYLKDGDPDGAEYIRLKDLYNYLSIALPASNLPTPRFLTQQDIGDLVLCRNPARQTTNAASSAPQYDATSHSPAPASAVSTGNSYITQGKRVGRIVEYDEGYSEFNPLPSALMDVDSRVPRTPEQLAELLDDRPPNWESRLFAGVALQELGHLRAKFARQFRGPIEWNGDERSGQAAYSFITGRLDDIGEAIRDLDEILANGRHLSILNSEDFERIKSHATELTRLIESLMDITYRLRATAITNRHLRTAADILAHFPDQAIVSITEMIHKYVSEIDASGQRIMNDEDPEIALTATIKIPDGLSDRFSDAISKY